MTHVGPRNHVLDEAQDHTNPFAATRGDKTAMRPFAFGPLCSLTASLTRMEDMKTFRSVLLRSDSGTDSRDCIRYHETNEILNLRAAFGTAEN